MVKVAAGSIKITFSIHGLFIEGFPGPPHVEANYFEESLINYGDGT